MRDRRTGRFVHQWGWQGWDHAGYEYTRCDCCGKWKRSGQPISIKQVPEMLYANPNSDSVVSLWTKLSK